jgi:hypothetical protein
MGWMSKVGDLLTRYTGGASAGAATGAAPAPDVHQHFDQVAAAAPTSVIAEGLAAAFRSDQTPAFGQMLTTLFNNSSGEQKAGLLNQLMGSMNPAMLSQVLGGAGLGSLLAAGGGKVTPEQAQNISPDAMQQIAAHAEKANPSIVDSVSSFYAQHTTLVKTLGGAALSVALAKVAQHQQKA